MPSPKDNPLLQLSDEEKTAAARQTAHQVIQGVRQLALNTLTGARNLRGQLNNPITSELVKGEMEKLKPGSAAAVESLLSYIEAADPYAG